MPEAISRNQIDAVLDRMGYSLVFASGSRAGYRDRNYPGDEAHYLQLNFRGDHILWEYLRDALELDGANPSVFLAELESL